MGKYESYRNIENGMRFTEPVPQRIEVVTEKLPRTVWRCPLCAGYISTSREAARQHIQREHKQGEPVQEQLTTKRIREVPDGS